MKNENQFIQTIFTMEGSSKKRKIDQEQKIQELEKRIEKLEKKKPRKNTVAELDEKINTILDILAKIVVPTTATQEDFIPL